ncbi:hypothetical protein SAMN06265348_10150 [Pedobacter westerhofensis]|uniref:Uncharacterized protein n=1 Tax=Pedobacter westerhofensis TaxID=425512 RepID=A0A521ACV6_9SPHI|nr:hypothetical protein [Pedobacter westerhofensis]SMO32520.1 hypothetical protein SAMN06265348_10150 [Pedobacter westerhofensis]
MKTDQLNNEPEELTTSLNFDITDRQKLKLMNVRMMTSIMRK